MRGMFRNNIRISPTELMFSRKHSQPSVTKSSAVDVEALAAELRT